MMSSRTDLADAPPSSELAQSISACESLARKRTENFHVLTKLLPRRFQADFAVLYAFCRAADDAADERGDREQAGAELEALRGVLDCVEAGGAVVGFAGYPFARYVGAWVELMGRVAFPRQLFDDLLDAFLRDQVQNRYATMAELRSYCAGSADPVGRLVLWLLTTPEQRADAAKLAEMFRLSDATCTALQLTNFWQDVADDFLVRNRIYIPQDLMAEFDLTEDDLRAQVLARKSDARFVALIERLVDETAARFGEGRKLWPLLEAEVRPVVELFTLGGEGILQRIRGQGYDVLARRPTLSAAGKLRIYLQAVVKKWVRH